MISNNGTSLFGGRFMFLQQFYAGENVSSITFSNLDGDNDTIYGISIDWKNPLSGAVNLELLPNGIDLPIDSGGTSREQYCINTNLREDTSYLNEFIIADLDAGATNTQCIGTLLFIANREFNIRTAISECWKKDALLTSGDRYRFATYKIGYSHDHTNITSITIQTSNATNAIGIDSDFRLFKPI